MKSILKGLSLLFLLLTFWSTANAGVRVTHRFLNNSAFEIFFLKDFDVNSPSVGPPIFFLDIINDDPVAHTVTLRLELHSKRHGNLSRGETRPFTLKPSEFLNITNKDLFSNSSTYRLDRFQIDDEIVGELLQDILATGKLPSDLYTFRVIVKPQDATPQFEHTFDIRVSNPKKLDIIGPGRPVGRRKRDCEPVFSNLPHFRWDTRMRIVRFILAEWTPGEDPENALNREPRFTRIFVIGSSSKSDITARDLGFRDIIERLPSNSFQYPASGTSLPLKPGGIYVYRFVGLVNSSSGPFTVPSEIHCFRIPRMDQVGAGRQQFELILRSLLGSDYEKLFGEDGDLADYRPTRITVDGKEMTVTEILTKLPKLRRNFSGYTVE